MVLKKTAQVLMLCSVALPFHTPASANPTQLEQTFANPRVEAASTSVRKGRQTKAARRNADQPGRHGRMRTKHINHDASLAVHNASSALLDRHSVGDQAYVGSTGSNLDRPAKNTRRHDRARAVQTVERFDPAAVSGYQAFGAQATMDSAAVGGSKRGRRAAAKLAMAGSGESGLVAEARRWLGTNPTKRSTLWCAAFMNFVLERSGKTGTGSDMAKSFASYGQRVSGPQIGAIAVMTRGPRGGHVGVVSGVDANGNPIVISGNHNRTVAEAVYPRGRVYAYVMPQ